MVPKDQFPATIARESESSPYGYVADLLNAFNAICSRFETMQGLSNSTSLFPSFLLTYEDTDLASLPNWHRDGIRILYSSMYGAVGVPKEDLSFFIPTNGLNEFIDKMLPLLCYALLRNLEQREDESIATTKLASDVYRCGAFVTLESFSSQNSPSREVLLRQSSDLLTYMMMSDVTTRMQRNHPLLLEKYRNIEIIAKRQHIVIPDAAHTLICEAILMFSLTNNITATLLLIQRLVPKEVFGFYEQLTKNVLNALSSGTVRIQGNYERGQ